MNPHFLKPIIFYKLNKQQYSKKPQTIFFKTSGWYRRSLRNQPTTTPISFLKLAVFRLKFTILTIYLYISCTHKLTYIDRSCEQKLIPNASKNLYISRKIGYVAFPCPSMDGGNLMVFVLGTCVQIIYKNLLHIIFNCFVYCGFV